LVNGAIGIEPDLELLSSESSMGWKGVGLDYPKPDWCSCRGALLSGNGLNCSDSDFLSMYVSIWFRVENYYRLGVCFGLQVAVDLSNLSDCFGGHIVRIQVVISVEIVAAYVRFGQ